MQDNPYREWSGNASPDTDHRSYLEYIRPQTAFSFSFLRARLSHIFRLRVYVSNNLKMQMKRRVRHLGHCSYLLTLGRYSPILHRDGDAGVVAGSEYGWV